MEKREKRGVRGKSYVCIFALFSRIACDKLANHGTPQNAIERLCVFFFGLVILPRKEGRIGPARSPLPPPRLAVYGSFPAVFSHFQGRAEEIDENFRAFPAPFHEPHCIFRGHVCFNDGSRALAARRGTAVDGKLGGRKVAEAHKGRNGK